MNSNKRITTLLHSELMGDMVNMVIKNHLSYNQAELLFGEVLAVLKDIPYQQLPANQEHSAILKEKPSEMKQPSSVE